MMDEATMRDVPIGIAATGTRREFDSMGEIDTAMFDRPIVPGDMIGDGLAGA